MLGYLPQDFGVYPHLSALEFLAYLAAAKGLAARPARARIDAPARAGQPHRGAQEAARQPLRRHAAAGRYRPGVAQRPALAHRRRAHRRPRPRRARPLPQPARRAVRRPYRDPVDPHRVRRRGGSDAHRRVAARSPGRRRSARGASGRGAGASVGVGGALGLTRRGAAALRGLRHVAPGGRRARPRPCRRRAGRGRDSARANPGGRLPVAAERCRGAAT